MTEVTIQELLEKEGIMLIELADKLGVSVSLLSRIKTGDTVVTTSTQKLFQKFYPEYELTSGKNKWKDLYYEQFERNLKLEKELSELKKVAGIE